MAYVVEWEVEPPSEPRSPNADSGPDRSVSQSDARPYATTGRRVPGRLPASVARLRRPVSAGVGRTYTDSDIPARETR